jgi:hypothetical protein
MKDIKVDGTEKLSKWRLQRYFSFCGTSRLHPISKIELEASFKTIDIDL